MPEFNLSQSGGIGTLELQGDLNIENAGQLKDALIAALKETDHLVLKIEETAEVGLTTMQLLCSAHRTAISLGKRITLEDASLDGLTEMMDRAGFSRQKGCDFDEDKTCFWLKGTP